MVRRPVAALAALAVAACSDGEPVGVDRLVAHTVVVDGVAYFPDGILDTTDVAIGPVHTTVQRRVDCSQGRWLDRDTHVSGYCPLSDRESNFLEAGTPIYRIDGVPAGERLAFHYDYSSEWVALKPTPAGASTDPRSIRRRGVLTGF
jgi:hypothetical protein